MTHLFVPELQACMRARLLGSRGYGHRNRHRRRMLLGMNSGLTPVPPFADVDRIFATNASHAGAAVAKLRGPVPPFCGRGVCDGRGERACQHLKSAVSSPPKRAPTAHPRGLQGLHESEKEIDPICFKQQVP